MRRGAVDALREHIFDYARAEGLGAAEVVAACAEVVGGARAAAGRLAGRDPLAEDAEGAREALGLAGASG